MLRDFQLGRMQSLEAALLDLGFHSLGSWHPYSANAAMPLSRNRRGFVLARQVREAPTLLSLRVRFLWRLMKMVRHVH